MKRFHFFTLLQFLCLLFAALGCAAAQPAPFSQPAPAPQPSLDYDAMLSRSLVFTGNNARLKAAIAKAKAGREVVIAYIGGSITEGAGAGGTDKSYASLSAAAFKAAFGQSRALNAGMSGTPSTLGVIRYQRDVRRKLGADPDVLVVEFAVNDGDDMTGGAAYESLVRDVLAAKNAPAVVLLFAVFRTGWNLQERYLPLGKAYGLPMISIKEAIAPELNSRTLAAKKFFADEYHPNSYGHQVMADCLARLFKTADAAPVDKKGVRLPDAVIGKQYQGMTMIDAAHVPTGVTVKAGGFSEKDPNLSTFIHTPGEPTFPDNWHKKDPAAQESFTMTLVCRSLFLVHKLSSGRSFGAAEVSIDGTPVKTVDGRSHGGWDNPVTVMLLSADKAARRTVSIRMADASADKMFSILAFGFTK